MSELSPVRRERIQSKVNKLILRDEGQEKLDQLISVNEIDDSDAAEMIKAAKKIRVDLIRGLCMKNLYVGCMVMFLAIGAVYCFAMIVGTMTKPVWAIAGLLFVVGLFQVIQGVVGIAFASGRKGPVEEQ